METRKLYLGDKVCAGWESARFDRKLDHVFLICEEPCDLSDADEFGHA